MKRNCDAAGQETRVFNERLVADAGKSELLRSACVYQLREVDARLNARPDLDAREKRNAAAYLNKPENARLFDVCLGDTDILVAIGLWGSHARDFDGATGAMGEIAKKGLRAVMKRHVEEQMANARDPYITVYQPISGWKAVMYAWDEESAAWAPERTGLMPHRTREAAVAEGQCWARAEDVRFIDPHANEQSSGQLAGGNRRQAGRERGL